MLRMVELYLAEVARQPVMPAVLNVSGAAGILHWTAVYCTAPAMSAVAGAAAPTAATTTPL
jgi:hypothetical protein